MDLSKKIIGKWSIDVMYGPGAEEDIELCLYPNGTGWIAFSHYVLCELDTFKWCLDHDGLISFTGDTYYDLDNKTSKSDFNFNNISIDLKIEKTPGGKELEVIVFSVPIWCKVDKFGFITRELNDVKIPKFD